MNKVAKSYRVLLLILLLLFLICSSSSKSLREIQTRYDYLKATIYNYGKKSEYVNYVDANFERFLKMSPVLEDTIRENFYTIKEGKKFLKKMKWQKIIGREDFANILVDLNSFRFEEAGQKLKIAGLLKKEERYSAQKYFLMGLINEMDLNYAEAIKNYNEAVKLQQRNAKYHNKLAQAYGKLGNTKRAGEIFEKALGMTTDIRRDGLERSRTLLGLAMVYNMRNDFDSAYIYYTKAFFVASEDGYLGRMNKWVAVIKMGDISFRKGEYLQAINLYKKAYKISRRLWHKKLKAYSLARLSTAYYYYGNYNKGLNYAKKALRLAKDVSDFELVAEAKYTTCLNLEYLRSEIEASDYCKQAELNMDRLTSFVPTPQFLTKLGDMVSFAAPIRDYQKAVNSYQKAYNMLNKSNLNYAKVSVLTKLGSAYRGLGGYDNALKYLKMAEDVKKELGLGGADSCIECNRASTYLMKDENRTAIKVYKDAIELTLKDGDKAMLGSLYNGLGLSYQRSGKNQEALENFQKSLDIHRQIYRYDHHYIKYSEDRCREVLSKL